MNEMHYTIWVTHACNLRCSYCYEGEEKQDVHMSMETAEQVISFLKKSEECLDDNIKISIHGGEPLLNYEILYYLVQEVKAWKKDVKIDMTTNATLLNQNNLSFIKDNIDEISISIDGTQEVHDMNRMNHIGRGTFNDVTKHIDDLLKQSDNVIARMTVTHETVERLYDSVLCLYNLGFRFISPIINQYDRYWNEKSMEVLKSQLLKISKNFQLREDGIRIGMLEEMKFRTKSKCCPGEMTMNIDAYGDIYPCAYVVGNHRFKMGNITTGIKTEKLQELQEINNKEIENCKLCKWTEYCHGYRCKLFNYAVAGDFAPGFTACKLEHVLLEIYKAMVSSDKIL